MELSEKSKSIRNNLTRTTITVSNCWNNVYQQKRWLRFYSGW